MGKVILIYLIVQLITTAFGLSVIETIRPIVNKKLIDDGYVLKNKNSMYKFNENLTSFLLGLIPCYYLFKALNMVKGSDAFEREAINQIRKGNYVTVEEYLYPTVEVNKEDTNVTKIVSEPEPYEKDYKHVARRNDYLLTETNENNVKFQEAYTESDKLEITPFSDKYVMPKTKAITVEDILEYIFGFSPEKLDRLGEKAHELAEVKRGHPVLTLKD